MSLAQIELHVKKILRNYVKEIGNLCEIYFSPLSGHLPFTGDSWY